MKKTQQTRNKRDCRCVNCHDWSRNGNGSYRKVKSDTSLALGADKKVSHPRRNDRCHCCAASLPQLSWDEQNGYSHITVAVFVNSHASL
eukprot:1827794-Amphidinium_carterae.1